MAIDLQQFHQVFFEESLEGLDVMEDGLLKITDGVQPDPELINTIFRAAHSIKGGSGTFGFSKISNFTHVIETLLDEVRDGKRVLDSESVELLLKSCDCLRGMVSSLQSGSEIESSEAEPLVAAFERILAGGDNSETLQTAASAVDNSGAAKDVSETAPEQSPQDILSSSFDTLLNGNSSPASASVASVDYTKTASDESLASADEKKHWKISFVPEPQILMTGNEPSRIFRELATLGELKVEVNSSQVPDFLQLTVDECFLSWTLWLSGDVDRDEILEVFDWVIDDCKLEVEPVSAGFSGDDTMSSQTDTETVSGSGSKTANINDTNKEPEELLKTESKPSEVTEKTPETAAMSDAAKTPALASASSSIRVGIDKVDSLINLVGELVITQSMLSELGSDFDMSKLDRLANGLEQLVQNTRELQESVMQIRMLPISYAFNRFPRMIRDLSAKTGKKIELKLSGENTELDKTVMEQISDPLVHLVRNAADHGIEMPSDRVSNGKPEVGTIHLDAYHKGGNIVVEIRDDGRGIDPQKILAKAKERGVVGADQQLNTSEIYELIFEPGFSTADVVSDISGRGVGMDVVRRNISNLGGRIEIDSELGKGSMFRVHLPLTLAILDGQLVRIGDQTYIIPLVAIVESLQIKTELVNQVSGNMVLYRLREDNVPIIPVYQEFNITADNTELDDALLVVVEGDGQKVGLLVDDLLAQQQVVIKSLETNFRRVEGVSGATILGDGSVALILDIPGLMARVSRRARNSQRNRAA